MQHIWFFHAHNATSYLIATIEIPRHQSAYRKGHSTDTALVKVCSDLIGMMDSGEHALLALLDLSFAFDTFDHDILLTRLSRSLGVRGDALSWIRSYLSGRIHTVRFGGTESSSHSMMCGVPQSLVLGPLLFILYTAALLALKVHFYTFRGGPYCTPLGVKMHPSAKVYIIHPT